MAVADSITVAEGGTATVLVGGSSSVLANDTDVDLPNDSLTVTTTPVSGPAHGSLTLSADGTFSYTHDDSENFTDSFTYHANDGVNDSNVATVTITITPVNDAPVGVADGYTVDEGATLTTSDLDGSTSTLNDDSVLVNDTDAENDTLTAGHGPPSHCNRVLPAL